MGKERGRGEVGGGKGKGEGGGREGGRRKEKKRGRGRIKEKNKEWKRAKDARETSKLVKTYLNINNHKDRDGWHESTRKRMYL